MRDWTVGGRKCENLSEYFRLFLEKYLALSGLNCIISAPKRKSREKIVYDCRIRLLEADQKAPSSSG